MGWQERAGATQSPCVRRISAPGSVRIKVPHMRYTMVCLYNAIVGETIQETIQETI